MSVVRAAVNDMGKSSRAPAAADCAWRWASTMTIDVEQLGDPDVLKFFQEAADLHRRAYEQRLRTSHKAAADKYLADEILLRRQFLAAALDASGDVPNEGLRRHVVKHLSSLAGALALAQQYKEIDKVLANAQATVIDEAAINVWLQALWSCAKFDGTPTNLCTPDNRQACRDTVTYFLSSVDEMKGRRFPPQTVRDIVRLRSLAGEGGCLR